MIALASLRGRRRALLPFATLAAGCALGQSPALAAPGWTWPVHGEVITGYGNGSDPYAGGQHRGIDVAAPVGTPVVAAAAGIVRFAGVAGSSGLTVSVRTADGRFDTSYLHLSGVEVAEGRSVRAGERLGAVGTTGRRSVAAPHLHFGVREAGSRHAYRDPLGLLPTPPSAGSPRVPVGAPLGVPVSVVPVPRGVRSPVRGRAPERAPRPARIPARRRIRVPVGRRVRVPSGRGAPLPRPIPAPGAAPSAARRPAPARAPSPGRAPSAGPEPVPRPLDVPEARRPAEGPRPAPNPSPGPDLGWALACVGLLLAAACLGRPRGGEGGGERGRTLLGPIMRPLPGARR